MPTEAGRKTSLKRIYNPDNQSQFVDIPVIDEITFVDASDRYQETQFTFLNNDETGSRTVHSVTVTSTTSPPDRVQVERIDKMPVLDPTDRGQETQFEIDNVTGENSTPPHFSTHTKTHTFKIYGTGANSQCYIVTERIDELRVMDPSDRGQETFFTLGPWSDESN